MKSKALEINLSDTRVHVHIDEKYRLLPDIVSSYVGIRKKMETFLKEVCHPYRNLDFIVDEARHLSLHYFYIYRDHRDGPAALRMFSDIMFDSFESGKEETVKMRAVDNLMLLFQHIARESGDALDRFLPVVNEGCAKISAYEQERFFYFVKSYYQPYTLFRLLDGSIENGSEFTETINYFLLKFYRCSLDYWIDQVDPAQWMRTNADIDLPEKAMQRILAPVRRNTAVQWRHKLERIAETADMRAPETGRQLVQLPGFQEMVRWMNDIPAALFKAAEDETEGHQLKLVFLFYMIHVPGLSAIHESALREINTTLVHLIGDRNVQKDVQTVDRTVLLLKAYTGTYPATVLDCIHRIGQAVYDTGEVELINHFIDSAVELGFQFPMIEGTGEDWQIKSNAAHVKNIRIFLDLIASNPKVSVRLLSALIISLAVGGVFIKDTDLFCRDVTRFLNADIRPVFNLVKQLARLLPAFFNEIGAEGDLREISTRLDELSKRKDKLIHFLRKQSHVESSSRVVDFIEEIFQFWKSGNKEKLESFVPPSIFQEIREKGEFVDGPGRILNNLEKEGLTHPKTYLYYKTDALEKMIDSDETVSEHDRSRVKMAIEFYRLLCRKYRVDQVEIENDLAGLKSGPLPDTGELLKGLQSPVREEKISSLLTYMEQLKELILSDQTFDVKEEIYHKRHFAVDIPSMYGSYHEAKFDALGMTLRLESIVNVLFEDLINEIDLRLITKATFTRIYDVLSLFRSALKIDGIVSNQMDQQLQFLRYSIEIREFSYTQYLDIFKGFARAVADAVNDHFNSIHSGNLRQIDARIGRENIASRYVPAEDKACDKLDQRVAEIFFRDRIATSLGLQQLDVFLNRILHTLFLQSEKLPRSQLNRLLNYDPKLSVADMDRPGPIGSNIILLGNKGLNLIKLKNLGLPVPEGFIITTEVFRCLEIIDSYGPASDNFKKHVAGKLAHLEKISGLAFGDPEKPLLLSVRSGSSISQPGMLDSFLNVGLNEDIARSLARITDNPWFAWDCYRRFLQGYGMAFGINRNAFDRIINSYKKSCRVEFKRHFTGNQMEEVALAYRRLLADSEVELIESPMDQLFLAISKVFSSWNSKRARDFRRIMGISDDWGTAVTVQSMVFGNRSRQSGSGVVFSHSPRLPGDTVRLWGDFTIGNQGEDVVSGLVRTLPVSEMQRKLEARDTKISLESRFPEVYDNLKQIVNKLIFEQRWNPQEFEFTFEGPDKKDLYILQAREMSVRDRKEMLNFDATEEELNSAYIGQGIGVGGGAMSGRVVFTLREIDEFRKTDPDSSLILLRNDTVPDDILEIDAADGLLTAKGGLTSHAAVVAYNLDKTCVVGCENLFCSEEDKSCTLNGVSMTTGDYISINGQRGTVFQGKMELKKL